MSSDLIKKWIDLIDSQKESTPGCLTILNNCGEVKVLNPSDCEVDMIRDGELKLESVELCKIYVDPDDEENIIIGEDNIRDWLQDLKDSGYSDDEIDISKEGIRIHILITT